MKRSMYFHHFEMETENLGLVEEEAQIWMDKLAVYNLCWKLRFFFRICLSRASAKVSNNEGWFEEARPMQEQKTLIVQFAVDCLNFCLRLLVGAVIASCLLCF